MSWTPSPVPVEAAGAARHPSLDEFEVPLPSSLARYGRSVKASLFGSGNAPVVLVLGGISANRFPAITASGSPGWWGDLAGQRKAIDALRYRILGFEFAADEHGKFAPTTFDQADVIGAALDALGIERAHAIIGASYGGMAALGFGQHFPDRVGRLVIVSAGAEPHPTSTAYRELQRRIVALGEATGADEEALSIARGLAMLTYRSREEFERRFAGGISGDDVLSTSEAGAYLRARGEAYRSVMSTGRFLSLSASIDRHRVDPSKIGIPALLIGSTSDQLVPPSQMKSLAERYRGPAELHLLPSLFGHDMFLKNAARLSELIRPFLRSAP